MFKKITRYFSYVLNNKRGNTIDAIIVTPVWLFLLAFIGSQMQVHQAKQSLEDSLQIVSRYVMMSNNPNDAIITVNNYLDQRSDAHYFDKFTITNLEKMHYKIGSESTLAFQSTTDTTKFADYWLNGNMVEIKLSRKTPFANNSVLKFCVYNNKDICYSLLSEKVTAKTVVFITKV